MFNVENLNDEYFTQLDPDEVLDIKDLPIFEKNQCFKYFLDSKVVTNKLILYNIFLMISGIEIEDDDFDKGEVLFSSREEFEDLVKRLGYEITEFRVNLLERYLCIMAGLANSSSDSKIDVEPIYQSFLEYVDPIFVANLILNYIKNVNADHIKPANSAQELFEKINYMKGVDSYDFDH